MKIDLPSLEDRFLFTKEGLAGPSPYEVKRKCTAWVELQCLTSLHQVKSTVETLFEVIEENYQRQLSGRAPFELSLNRIFVGWSGTGKTTVAKLYGRILVDLGLLSHGEGT